MASQTKESDPFAMIKPSRAKAMSEAGSSNSDNSALVGFGNSFGFNFDSEEGQSNNSSPPNGEQNDNSEDSDGNGGPPAVSMTSSAGKPSSSSRDKLQSSVSSLTGSSGGSNNTAMSSHEQSAADASANLKSIAMSSMMRHADEGRKLAGKRKSLERSDADSGGYNSDDDDDDGSQRKGSSKRQDAGSVDSIASSRAGGKKKRRLDKEKREERNAREKERSFRISKQINELRDLLSSGGVIVPKGTKSSVLSEAANYIRTLQQHQYRSEIDRHQLIQQMQLIGGGAHGPQAAQAIRHVAAQNGVWSLGNFGGIPPKSAMSFFQPSGSDSSEQQSDGLQSMKIESSDLRFVFNSCGVGMAIASMGGAFIDCNHLFCQLSNYTKQELCSLTIFNLTARQDLQQAFDLISQMISPPMDSRNDAPKPIVLRGAMKNRNDLGLSITLVKGDDGIAKCFCVTLIKNPASPFDTNQPIPVSFESVQQPIATIAKNPDGIDSAPAFTSG